MPGDPGSSSRPPGSTTPAWPSTGISTTPHSVAGSRPTWPSWWSKGAWPSASCWPPPCRSGPCWSTTTRHDRPRISWTPYGRGVRRSSWCPGPPWPPWWASTSTAASWPSPHVRPTPTRGPSSTPPCAPPAWGTVHRSPWSSRASTTPRTSAPSSATPPPSGPAPSSSTPPAATPCTGGRSASRWATPSVCPGPASPRGRTPSTGSVPPVSWCAPSHPPCTGTARWSDPGRAPRRGGAPGPGGRAARRRGPGLSGDALAAADVVATVPMDRGVDSLNVATAAAVALDRLARA